MDELIKELAEDCWDYYEGTLDGNIREFDYKKFAELIVRECVAQCEQVATDADAMTKSEFVTDAGRQLHEGVWGGAKNCAAGIKEHFGVEE